MTIAEKIAMMQGGTPASKLLSKPMLVSSSPAPEPKKIEEVEAEERNLSQPSGHGVDHTPISATQPQQMWNQALNAFASEMCVVNDPVDRELVWIALRINGTEERPLLLYRLPYWEHPLTIRQDNEPF
jgi:hypothetical protein